MRHAGVDQHGITFSGIKLCTIAQMNGNIGTASKVLLCPGAKLWMDFSSDYCSVRAYKFSEDRRIVAHACTHVINTIALAQLKSIDVMGKCSRLSVGKIA